MLAEWHAALFSLDYSYCITIKPNGLTHNEWLEFHALLFFRRSIQYSFLKIQTQRPQYAYTLQENPNFLQQRYNSFCNLLEVAVISIKYATKSMNNEGCLYEKRLRKTIVLICMVKRKRIISPRFVVFKYFSFLIYFHWKVRVSLYCFFYKSLTIRFL